VLAAAVPARTTFTFACTIVTILVIVLT
jgi:hypothetical protein